MTTKADLLPNWINLAIAKKLKFLPYAIVGMALFILNSDSVSHPYLQVYVTLLEVKLGIVLVYLLSKLLSKK
jgi:hypothetical protein